MVSIPTCPVQHTDYAWFTNTVLAGYHGKCRSLAQSDYATRSTSARDQPRSFEACRASNRKQEQVDYRISGRHMDVADFTAY